MDIICNTLIKDPNYYFSLNKPTRVYVCDLPHQAPSFIHKVKKLGIKVYGANGRRPKEGKWIAVLANGISSPKTYWIKLSNNVIIIDYSGLDTKKDFVEEKEMYRIIKCAHEFAPNLDWSTANNMIKSKVTGMLENQCIVSSLEREHYDFFDTALRGGANCVLKKNENIIRETHIDYHQLYASVMKSERFPYNDPILKDGYFPHEFAIYAIEPGTKARLKKDGYPIIPIGRDFNGMAGANGEWFDVGEVIQYICDPDLQTMIENYEFKDNEINIAATLYYPNSFEGKELFGSIIDEIYQQRLKYKGQPEERFYKILNEVLPGHFERRAYAGDFWKKDFKPSSSMHSTYYNPKIGIFITAYGRQRLNWLLHQFDRNKIIGFDTDCVFFAGTMNAIPQSVKDKFGDLPGQLHEDGIYRDVIHKASKSYTGFDVRTGEAFSKIAGLSKSGKIFVWNKELEDFECKEATKDEREYMERLNVW